MNYKARRNFAGISLYTMAKQLGIKEEKYKEVEDKKRPLEGYLVDKFQKVIENSKQIKFERSVRMTEINKWFESGEINRAIEEYGYTRVSLANELKLAPTTVQDAIKHSKATNDVKEKIYDFLTDPINKKIKEEPKEEDTGEKDKKNKKLAERLKKLNLKQSDFAKEVGCSQVTISCFITGTRPVSKSTIKKIEETIIKLEKEKERIEEPVVEAPVEEIVEVAEEVAEAPEVVEEAPVVETEEKDYKALYEDLKHRYDILHDETFKAKRQIMLYEKLIEKM